MRLLSACVSLNQGRSDREGAFDWGQMTGTLTVTGVNGLPSAWCRLGRRTVAIEQHFYLLKRQNYFQICRLGIPSAIFPEIFM